ncbi:MAG: response regulator [Candidatus Cloacimonetes bacterium]|nr:response regulator [Candidatus Cloacimonadota bacterium]
MTEIFNENSLLSIEEWKENLSVSFELTQLDYLAVVAYSEEETKLIYHLETTEFTPDFEDQDFQNLFSKEEKLFLVAPDLKKISNLHDVELLISLPIFTSTKYDYFLLGIHFNTDLNSKNSLIFRALQNEATYIQREYQHYRKKNTEDSFHELLLKSSFRELGLIRKALDSSTIVAITNSSGKITYANHQLCQISGYQANELIGQDHRLLSSGNHSKEFIKDLWDTIKSGKVWKGLLNNKTKNGELYWVDTTIVPFSDENKKITQYVAIRHDITQKIELSKNLEREKEKLNEALTELKEAHEHLDRTSRFVDMGTLAAEISHDFNNTLSVITMGIEVCLINELPHDVLETLIKMKSTALNASALTKKLMSLGKKINTSPKPTILSEMINDGLQLLTPVFHSLGIQITIDLAPNLPIVLLNSSALSDVIRNLTMNSLHSIQEAILLKEVPKAGHKFSINCSIENQQIVIKITDTGRGIPKRIQSKIYDPFFTTKERSEQKGTGLGMSMVFSTINSHSGKIHLDSFNMEDWHNQDNISKETGTSFTIQIPAKLPQEKNEKLQSLLPKQTTKPDELIFVVDDEKHFLRFIKTMINSFGYNNVQYFNNGEELLTEYHQRVDDQSELPKLIITDIQMPKLNGFDLLQQIFQADTTQPATIVMTGKADDLNLNRFKDLGVSNYLMKPFSVSQLRAMMDKALL